MSDYFRFYDDSLDEPRLQYAINRNPHVVSVWVWVLSQCAKKKQDTIDKVCDATLLGVSHKLNIGAGVLKECFKILSEIKYIEPDGDCYKVRKWNDLQSEYMRTKQYRKPKDDTYHIRTLSVDDTSRGEERRGEESKGENKDTSVSSKKKYGELGTVRLAAEEYQKLVDAHGKEMTDHGIEILDGYLASKGRKYKSHYACLKKDSWVWSKLKEQKKVGPGITRSYT